MKICFFQLVNFGLDFSAVIPTDCFIVKYIYFRLILQWNAPYIIICIVIFFKDKMLQNRPAMVVSIKHTLYSQIIQFLGVWHSLVLFVKKIFSAEYLLFNQFFHRFIISGTHYKI
jgi:hypothetical protein